MPQFPEGALGHGARSVRGPVKVGVMQEDNVLIPREVDVALHAVGAVGQGLQVGGPGVFGERGAGAAVGKDQRPLRR